MKVSGGGSRKQPQKSFNLSCKEGFSYSFFQHLPYTHYKSLRLRVSGQDWRETHIRDALMHTLVAKTHIDVQGIPASGFIHKWNVLGYLQLT